MQLRPGPEAHKRARLAHIHEKLRKATERRLASFGCEAHRFQLEPAADLAEVRRLEEHYGVALPEEYRCFITTVGDGGAGPAFGLHSLRGGLECDNVRVTPELLQTAFPYTEFTDALHLLDRSTDTYASRPGSIALCHEGCGHLHFLVITGPTRGQMWIDSTVADGGYIPLGVSFLTWYERWLDDTLEGGCGTWWFRM